jgi:AraC family transcriptional regulator
MCDLYHVVFPGTPVLIVQAGHRPVIANRNHAVFYNGRQVYRRGLLSQEGDRCLFIEADPEALDACAEAWGAPLGTGSRPTFPFVDGPLRGGSYLRQRLLARYLDRASCPDDLLVQETALNLIGQAIHDAFAVRGTPARSQRRSTDARQADLVEHAKEFLTLHFGESIGVDELARTVHVSPFHLARVFRARTGYSLHRYRRELRVRAALDLAETANDLTRLALDLGYASHSHFSDGFRRAYAMTPSAYRANVRNHDDRAELRLTRP